MSVDILAPEDDGATTIARLRHWNALYKQELRTRDASLATERQRSQTLSTELADAKATIRYLEDPTDAKTRALKKKRLAREDAIWKWRQDGMTFVAISRKFTITPTRASQIYHRAERRHQVVKDE